MSRGVRSRPPLLQFASTNSTPFEATHGGRRGRRLRVAEKRSNCMSWIRKGSAVTAFSAFAKPGWFCVEREKAAPRARRHPVRTKAEPPVQDRRDPRVVHQLFDERDRLSRTARCARRTEAGASSRALRDGPTGTGAGTPVQEMRKCTARGGDDDGREWCACVRVASRSSARSDAEVQPARSLTRSRCARCKHPASPLRSSESLGSVLFRRWITCAVRGPPQFDRARAVRRDCLPTSENGEPRG